MVTRTKAPRKTDPTEALGRRLTAVCKLLAMLHPAPVAWLRRKLATDASGAQGGLTPLPCISYGQLVAAWRKALKWTPGLDHALSVMLASVTSTRSMGDQLWIKVVGPAACGKSTLCEALSVNTDYVIAKSTIRGFHSGYREEGGGNGEDNSLIPLIKDKTLCTKDGDTLLQTPNLSQILSEARDLYDGTGRTHYRNRMGKDYSGIRMTWILCGTSSLRTIDSSELGERFLDCVIMDAIDNDLEDEILWRVVNRAQRNVRIESNGEPASQYPPELAQCMQLTGGYVGYLRENACKLLQQVKPTQHALRRCVRLGKFVAFMRARPSRMQTESSEREFGTRLVEQHVRLANCLAVVLNCKALGSEVMRRVTRVALDTARGQTLDITARLYDNPEGLEPDKIGRHINQSEERTRGLLRFLRQIGVAQLVERRNGKVRQRNVWRLTPLVSRLYEDVMLIGKEA